MIHELKHDDRTLSQVVCRCRRGPSKKNATCKNGETCLYFRNKSQKTLNFGSCSTSSDI